MLAHQTQDWHLERRRRGFTLTELLVVIAIITLLAGVLLVAMKGVRTRALATGTESTIRSFSAACDTFQLEHNRYPGVIPETVLAALDGPPAISGTENALLELMGSAVRADDQPFYGNLDNALWEEIVVDGATALGTVKVKVQRSGGDAAAILGEGPRIGGTPYAPYLTPSESELAVVKGQVAAAGFGGAGGVAIPELVDRWGQPLLYVRRMRQSGPLVGSPPWGSAGPPQFSRKPIVPYLESQTVGLGEMGRIQMYPQNTQGSILTDGSSAEKDATFGQILRHPAFGAYNAPLAGQARGEYAILSAGPDGVFFSATDGPGSPAEPVTDIVTDPDFNNPQVVDEYDDIRRFGGG